MLDGGYFKKVRKPKSSADVINYVTHVQQSSCLAGHTLLRSFWYDADPLSDKVKNPLGTQIDYSKTQPFTRNQQLLKDLESSDDFAVRRGRLVHHGWTLKGQCVKSLAKKVRALKDSDFHANIVQKGVDMRIGLDIARLAIRRTAEALVIVTGDGDIIPAMKLARIEGLRVYLDTLGERRPHLKVHADKFIPAPAAPPAMSVVSAKSSAASQT